MGRFRRQLSRSHHRLRSAGAGLPVYGPGLQHARFGGHAILQSTEISAEIKRRIAKMVVHNRNLIAGNFSEPITTSLIGARPLKTRARRIDGGYSVSGRKMFASMLEAANYVLVMAYPDE